MQTTGHIIIDGQTILILVRGKKHSRQFKLRKSGRPGLRFEDEEIYLSDNPDKLRDLLNGEVVEL